MKKKKEKKNLKNFNFKDLIPFPTSQQNRTIAKTFEIDFKT